MPGVIGFLHTADVHVSRFEALSAERGAAAEHVVRPDLLAAARRSGVTEDLARDVAIAVRELQARPGIDVVVCTCSSIGTLAEAAATPQVPVLRVDRPMAARAVELAGTGRIAVVAALESTVAPTRTLLIEEGARGRIVPVLATEAWRAFERGDYDAYLAQIAAAVRGLEDVDVVVLAQASMAGALALLTDHPVPVLASPVPAVEAALAVPRLRPARSEDAAEVDALLDLWARAAENADRPADTRDAVEVLLARDPDAVLVLEGRDGIVGTVVAGWDGWRGHLYRLAVAPEHRGRGHARRLVAAAEQRLADLGARRADAMVLQDNAAGRRWWDAASYAPQEGWRRWVRPLGGG